MYDVIIIGKGPAGISASLYTSRAGLTTLVLGKISSLNKSHRVDNYYGFESGIPGYELLDFGEKQTLRFGTIIMDDEVIALEYDFDGIFTVRTKSNSYQTNAVLLATGSEKTRIPIKNIDMFEGKGIHYCTVCDGYFYKNKKVAILGYNEYAKNEIDEMEQFTKDITLLTNGNVPTLDFGATAVVKKKIEGLSGSNFLESITYNDSTEEKFDGIFVAYGTASSVDFARKLGIAIKDNLIEVDEEQKTNLVGLYAAGDCVSKIKQIAVSVGQGAVAGLKIAEYIRNLRR